MNYMYLQANKLIIGRTVQLLKLKLNCSSIFRRRKFFYLAFFNLNCEAFKFDITLYEATDTTRQYLLHTNINYLVF